MSPSRSRSSTQAAENGAVETAEQAARLATEAAPDPGPDPARDQPPFDQPSAEADSIEAGSVEAAAVLDGSIRIACLDGDRYSEWEGPEALENLALEYGRPDARLWIDLCGVKPPLIAEVAKVLKLHPLLVEDIAERDQRAKLDEVEGRLHLVMFSLGWDDGTIYDRELDFVLGERFLLSSHSRWWDPRKTRHVRMGTQELLRRGTDYLLWALADDVIDNYFPILDRLGDEIDDLEDRAVQHADRATLERLFDLKRALIQVRRVSAPERECFNRFSNRETSLISRAHSLYYRDAYDHLIRLTDELDTYRELVSATVDAYLSTVNNNLSLIMKRLTGVTVILAGVGAVGGLFGMSEAPSAIAGNEGMGFWIVIAFTVSLAAGALLLLRRIDWI